jgi:hypothetical protein
MKGDEGRSSNVESAPLHPLLISTSPNLFSPAGGRTQAGELAMSPRRFRYRYLSRQEGRPAAGSAS